MPSDQPITQWLNSEQVDLLRPWFVDRNEPNYAWQHACSAVMALPALRAFWPMSSVDYTTASRARDVAGGGYHLSDNNTVLFGSGQDDALPTMVPYAEFDGVNQYLSRADGGAANWADITGTEAYIVAAQRGLTLGGWFRFGAVAPSTFDGVIGKFNSGTGQKSYQILAFNAGSNIYFVVSTNGVAEVQAISTVAISTNVWYFCIGRFTPSTEVAMFINNTKTTNVAGVPATIFDGAAQFEIARRNSAPLFLNGRASLCFLCAAALSDSIIGALFQSTRKAYNV